MEIYILRSMQHFRVISALKPLYTASTIAMSAPPNTCPRGGMVDTRDLNTLVFFINAIYLWVYEVIISIDRQMVDIMPLTF